MGWSVDDLDATMAELQARGLEFADEFGTVVVEGNYPSKGGRGERAAWFRDSEGNLLGPVASRSEIAVRRRDSATVNECSPCNGNAGRTGYGPRLCVRVQGLERRG